jgi:hypothetical protein
VTLLPPLAGKLPEAVEFPPGTQVLCMKALIPASWNTVDERSGRLYIGESVAGPVTYRIVELDSQPHDSESLRLALQNALTANMPGGMGTYSFVRSSSAGSTATAAIGSAAYQFYIITLSTGSFAERQLFDSGLVRGTMAGWKRP